MSKLTFEKLHAFLAIKAPLVVRGVLFMQRLFKMAAIFSANNFHEAFIWRCIFTKQTTGLVT